MKIIFITSLLFFSCCFGSTANKEIISVNQIDSNLSIVVKHANESNKISQIHFYLTYSISKNVLDEIQLSSIEYYYSSRKQWESRAVWYSYYNDSLEHVNHINNNKRFLDNLCKQTYVAYVVHPVDTARNVQSPFQPYIEEMKQQNKDTLHIGSIQQLKKSNPDLVNGFLKGDSICITYLKENKFFHILLPVEVK